LLLTYLFSEENAVQKEKKYFIPFSIKVDSILTLPLMFCWPESPVSKNIPENQSLQKEIVQTCLDKLGDLKNNILDQCLQLVIPLIKMGVW